MHRYSLAWLFLIALACCVGSARGQGPCPGDLNGDTIVDAADLGIMLAQFGCEKGYFGPCGVVAPNGANQPGCAADPGCESIVCATDPFCCVSLWDELCVTAARSFCPFTVTCIGDVNDDLVVNAIDLGILLSNFGCFSAAACGQAASGACCAPNGTPGCDNAFCCETVCAADPSCCAVAWDEGCAALAQSMCPILCSFPLGACCYPNGTCMPLTEPNCLLTGGVFHGGGTTCEIVCVPTISCGNGAAGDCCTANGTPFCNNASCCFAVCAQDPTCCTEAWDEVCASLAGIVCGIFCIPDGACCLADGSCIVGFEAVCSSLGGVYQGDETICDVQCPQPPACGDPDAGLCCVPNGTPSCDDAGCCSAVCATDPFCCTSVWDESCAELASLVCAACNTQPGACCLPDGSCVLAVPEFCSMAGGIFQGEATACETANCPTKTPCGDPSTGSCCVAKQSPYCDDAACCAAVCAADPFCCETAWDGLCAGQANTVCMACGVEPACGVAGTGSCCEERSTPFCDDAACCAVICGSDPFCCEVEWDDQCASAAVIACGGLCPPGACCYPDGSCAELSPLGCKVTGGAFQGAGVSCGSACPVVFGCGNSNAGDCCAANPTPYCNDSACYAAICQLDPFCCDTEWDSSCASAAAASCEVCLP